MLAQLVFFLCFIMSLCNENNDSVKREKKLIIEIFIERKLTTDRVFY